jgi:hypothetical protein
MRESFVSLTIGAESAVIHLTRGKIAVVDAVDVVVLNQWKWCARPINRCWYAYRGYWQGELKRTMFMHVQIYGASDQKIDHRDGNGLNNRRSNLRHATSLQNCWNQRARKGTSRFVGVSFNKVPSYRHKPWRATIKDGRRTIHIGHFATEEEAARAHDRVAIELRGEFARLNFPEVVREVG